MEYIIAGIRIAVPQEFTAGSFGTALVPFAAADEGPADLSVETRGEIRQADGYRELDEFDFADADADCRFGRDSEGYLLTMTPRDGCAAARFRKAFGAPLVTTDVTLRHNPALFRFGLWSMFNIAAVARQAVAIHSSVISLNDGAVLFLGESGTGKELVARAKAVLRRYKPSNTPTENPNDKCVEYADLTINLTNYSVIYMGHTVEMPPKELELLYFLASSPNHVFTREQLLDQIWGYEYIGDTRTVDVHIKRLREKIKDHANWKISTIWGIGYKFEVRN